MGSLTSAIADKMAEKQEEKNEGMYNAAASKLVTDAAITRKFDEKFGLLGSHFDEIQEEQYALFQKKMLAYGKNNITLGGNMDEEKERDFALMGISIRLHDKLSRLKNLLVNKNDNYVEDESIEDTLIDIANYGVIALMVKRNQWK